MLSDFLAPRLPWAVSPEPTQVIRLCPAPAIYVVDFVRRDGVIHNLASNQLSESGFQLDILAGPHMGVTTGLIEQAAMPDAAAVEHVGNGTADNAIVQKEGPGRLEKPGTVLVALHGEGEA